MQCEPPAQCSQFLHVSEQFDLSEQDGGKVPNGMELDKNNDSRQDEDDPILLPVVPVLSFLGDDMLPRGRKKRDWDCCDWQARGDGRRGMAWHG